VRRRAVVQRLEEEAEPVLRLLPRDVQQVEDLLLHFGPVDTNAAPADLTAVDHDVVRLRTDVGRVGFQLAQVLGHRRGERMVKRIVAFLVGVPLEQREIHHPQKGKALRIVQLQVAGDPAAQRRQCLVGDGFLVGHQHQHVSVLGAEPLHQLPTEIVAEELADAPDERRSAVFHLDLEPRQPLGAKVGHQGGQRLFDVAARVELARRSAQALDHSAVLDARGEDLERGLPGEVGDILELHVEAHVGTVDSVVGHRLRIRHPPDRQGHLDAEDLFPDAGDQLRMDRDHVVDVHEAHLDVDLREFRLAVGPRVLVAEATDDLEVLVDAADHQDLLEQLRRLRQCVEGVAHQAAGHEEIAGAFRRALSQHRRLDLPETLLVKIAARQRRDTMADAKPLLHLGPTQIEVSVHQPRLFVRPARVVQLKRRGLGHVEDFEPLDDHLDLSGGQLGIFQSLAARTDRAGRGDHPFTSHRASELVRFGTGLRVEHELRQSLPVPHVEEDQVAMIPIRLDPAGHHHALSGIGQPKLAAMMRSLQHTQNLSVFFRPDKPREQPAGKM